jgi:hypothetical protein
MPRIPPKPRGRRVRPPAEMPAEGRVWFAYRIRGGKAEKLDGVILTHTFEEAEAKAYAAFGAVSPAEKANVYVRETKPSRATRRIVTRMIGSM